MPARGGAAAGIHLPDTGATYFRHDTSAADAQDHGYRFTPNATASLDDDTRDNAKLVDTPRV